MDTHTIRPDFKKLRSYRSVHLFRFLIPHKNERKEPCPFASALAHEVRNPLATINLAVQILKSPIRDQDHNLYLDIIMNAAGQINELLTDLLASWNADEAQPEKYFVHQILDEALATMKDRILLKNIIVRKDYSTLDCKVLVNKQKIKIALTNIIANAIDAMAPERGKLKLITRSINGKCVIEIEDNGVGIPKKDLMNIFTPYFTGKTGGMGLGLSTTMDILRSNHALAEVHSEEGMGTRFILTFKNMEESRKSL